MKPNWAAGCSSASWTMRKPAWASYDTLWPPIVTSWLVTATSGSGTAAGAVSAGGASASWAAAGNGVASAATNAAISRGVASLRMDSSGGLRWDERPILAPPAAPRRRRVRAPSQLAPWRSIRTSLRRRKGRVHGGS